ncbi:uncharacterized protein LOC144713949 [Wolffia australiana]
MADQVEKEKSRCEDIPIPAEILSGILQQLQSMNSKLEANTASSSRARPRDSSRCGRVQVNQDSVTDQKVMFRKGDLPYFNGTNAQICLNCVVRFFKINRLTDEEKLQLVSLHMEGTAQGWFIYTEENFGFEHWLIFRQHFEKRYKLSTRSLCTQLMNLKQTGTVSEYRSEFEDLVAFLSHVQPDIQETAYFKGLKPEVRVELNKYRPEGIQEIMDLSIEAESNLAILEEQESQTTVLVAQPKVATQYISRPSYFQRMEIQNNPQNSRQVHAPHRNDITHGNSKKRITKLSTEEFLQRKEKGLCYSCNEKYTPGHHCQKKLSIYMLEEDIEELDQPITEEDLMQLDEEPLMGGEFMSLQRPSTDTGPRHGSFRLWGELYNHRVTVLIRPTVIQKLKIKVHPYHKFRIALGDGHCKQTNGICLNLPITFQGLVFEQNFIPFPLGSCDVILGIPWLKRLGWFHCNYHHLMLKFHYDGRIHTIISDPELSSLRYSRFEIDQANLDWEDSIHQISETHEHTTGLHLEIYPQSENVIIRYT